MYLLALGGCKGLSCGFCQGSKVCPHGLSLQDALVLAKGETPLWVRTERTGGTRAHTLQKAKSTASEQGLYIPSVDLTAQVGRGEDLHPASHGEWYGKGLCVSCGGFCHLYALSHSAISCYLGHPWRGQGTLRAPCGVPAAAASHTASPQDLLSFELLDINIVQELEQVPHNTPVGKHTFGVLRVAPRREHRSQLHPHLTIR